MSKATFSKSVGALCVLAAVGCAHNPPKELVDARAAYKQAASAWP